jgi:hypothetical protein
MTQTFDPGPCNAVEGGVEVSQQLLAGKNTTSSLQVVQNLGSQWTVAAKHLTPGPP